MSTTNNPPPPVTKIRPITFRWSAVARESMEQPIPDVRDNVPFAKAIREITRKTSQVKALPAFRAMFRATYQPQDPATDVEKVLQECLEVWRAQGFTQDELEGFRAQYEQLPRRGQRKSSSKESLGKSQST